MRDYSLPIESTAKSDIRRVGVEIEFGGLDEQTVAEIVTDCFGGDIRSRDDKGLIVENSDIGAVEIYLDSQYLHHAQGKFDETVIGIARNFVPIEIVCDPIDHTDLGRLDDLVQRLRRAGAVGTNGGVMLGYGVHFNPEVQELSLDAILPVLTSYALCEDALRHAADIDLSRRALPFVDPYPRKLVDALAQQSFANMDELVDCYLELAPSRNYGLDMMCLFAQIDPDRVAQKMDMSLISARPTFHYRLPDCRIDQAGWTLGSEWARWVKVEEISLETQMLEQLKSAWIDHRAALTTIRKDWRIETEKLTGSF